MILKILGKIFKRNTKNIKNEKKQPERNRGIQSIARLYDVLEWLNGKTDIHFFINLLNAFQIDLLLGSWTTFKSGVRWSILVLLSYTMLLGFVIYYLWNIAVVVIGIVKQKPNQNENKGKQEEKKSDFFGKFCEEIITEQTMGSYILIILIVRDTLLPLILIYGVSIPLVQLFSVIFFSIFLLIWLLIFRPFKSLLDNITLIFDNLLYSVVILLILIIYLLEDSLSIEIKNYFFGNLMIFCFSLIISSNIILGVFICIKGASFTIKRLISSNTKVLHSDQVTNLDKNINGKGIEESAVFDKKDDFSPANMNEGSQKAILNVRREQQKNINNAVSSTQTHLRLNIRVKPNKKTVLKFEEKTGF